VQRDLTVRRIALAGVAQRGEAAVQVLVRVLEAEEHLLPADWRRNETEERSLKSISRWQCASMSPGSTVALPSSMTFAPAGALFATASMRSPRTTM
jgi:hypothetical protein